MKLEKNWFYNFCIALSIVGIAYILICGISNVGENQEYPYVMKGILLAGFFLAWMLVQFLAQVTARLGLADKLNEKRKLAFTLETLYVVLIIGAAIIVRYIVILKLPMQPESDYKTYYEIADLLKNGTLQEQGEGYINYISMFPHVIGYSYILKTIFTFFGTSVFNGQVANIIFSVITVYAVYRIARRLGGRLAGVIALTVAAFWPSQVLYITMLSSEYAFTLLLYLSVWLFLHLVMDYDGTTKKAVRGILLHILLGCLIAVTSAIRPLAIILLAAIILCIFTQKMKLPNIPRNSISVWNRFLEKGWMRASLIVISYMIFSGILTSKIELAINQTMPSTSVSFGYNLLVGLNTDSKGGWNEEDSKYLYDNLESTGSAIQAQIASRNLAFERLTSDPKGIFNLFINKYELLWGNDDYGSTWNLIFLQEQNELTPERSDFLYRMQDYNNILYMAFIMFSILALIYMLQKKASYIQVLILLYLGTVGIHLFVESQNRYHYHILQVIMVMGAVGISYIFQNARESAKAAFIRKQEKKDLIKLQEEELEKYAEEEHLAMIDRYQQMTNTFDMKSAINNGNVMVTVSKGYIDTPEAEEADYDIQAEENAAIEEAASALTDGIQNETDEDLFRSESEAQAEEVTETEEKDQVEELSETESADEPEEITETEIEEQVEEQIEEIVESMSDDIPEEAIEAENEDQVEVITDLSITDEPGAVTESESEELTEEAIESESQELTEEEITEAESEDLTEEAIESEGEELTEEAIELESEELAEELHEFESEDQSEELIEAVKINEFEAVTESESEDHVDELIEPENVEQTKAWMDVIAVPSIDMISEASKALPAEILNIEPETILNEKKQDSDKKLEQPSKSPEMEILMDKIEMLEKNQRMLMEDYRLLHAEFMHASHPRTASKAAGMQNNDIKTVQKKPVPKNTTHQSEINRTGVDKKKLHKDKDSSKDDRAYKKRTESKHKALPGQSTLSLNPFKKNQGSTDSHKAQKKNQSNRRDHK